MWFETTRIVYFVKLKHALRTFFYLKLQRTAFQSKNAPKKYSQSSPRAPKTSPKCLQELPGAVLRSHTHPQSSPGALPSPNLCSRRRESLNPKEAPGRPLGPLVPPFLKPPGTTRHLTRLRISQAPWGCAVPRGRTKSNMISLYRDPTTPQLYSIPRFA